MGKVYRRLELMEHSEELCRLREMVAAQGATILAMEKAVPIALTAKDALAAADKAIVKADAAVEMFKSQRLSSYLHLIVTIGLALLVFFKK
jgi:hypothetical protein